MSTLYLGIGSNIGDKKANLEKAVSLISSIAGVRVAAVSSFYETKPVGGPKQPDFLNGVIKADSELSPEVFLKEAKGIEKKMGRKQAPKDHPRVIDIDVLLCDDLVFDSDDLVIPHPRMHERQFVLKGLNELAAGVIHPVLGRTVGELYKTCA